MRFGLVFALGPTPLPSTEARLLGFEECKLGQRCDDEPGAFAMYCHRSALPELVAQVRARGRDCTFEAFAETQALLRVGPEVSR